MENLRTHDLLKYFDYVITSEDGVRLKPGFAPKASTSPSPPSPMRHRKQQLLVIRNRRVFGSAV